MQLLTTGINGQDTVIFTAAGYLCRLLDAELFVMTPGAVGSNMFLRVCENDTEPEGGAVQHLNSFDCSALGRQQQLLIDPTTPIDPGHVVAVSFSGDVTSFTARLTFAVTGI